MTNSQYLLPWCKLFADDDILISETRKQANDNLEAGQKLAEQRLNIGM